MHVPSFMLVYTLNSTKTIKFVTNRPHYMQTLALIAFWKILLKFSDVMSRYYIFVKSDWKNLFFYEFIEKKHFLT